MRDGLRGDTRWRALLLAVLGVLVLTQMHIPGSFFEFRVRAYEDDAYYYTKIATQYWHNSFPTFDNVTHTNGYQPLWMFMAIIAAAPLVFFGADHYMPFALQLLNAALVLYAGQLLFRILRKEKFTGPLGVLCCVVALGFPLQSYLFNLMETASTVVGVLLLFFYLQRCLQNARPVNATALAALSFVVLMGRLDAGVFLLMVYAVLLLFVPLRKIILAGVLLCAMTAPYFAYNYSLNGSVMPISGMVKSRWTEIAEFEADGRMASTPADYWNSNLTWERRLVDLRNGMGEPLSEFLEIATFAWFKGSNNAIEVFSPAFVAGMLCFVLGVPLAFSFFLFARWRKTAASYRFLGLGVLLVLAFYAFQLFYYPFFSHIIYTWYLGLGLSALLLCFMILPGALMQRLDRGKQNLVAGFALALILAMDLSALRQSRMEAQHLYLPQNAIDDTAKWLRENTTPDARVGAWTAGLLGQYSGRSVINLEGLVADSEVLDTFDDMDIAKYILEKKINYVGNHFPDFEEGLKTPGQYRPDWVDIESRPPSIGGIWDAFTVPKVARGEYYTRWGWNVFWSHRYRPFWDYPEAFKVVFRQRAQHSTIFIFEVDQEKLREEIALRYEFMAVPPEIALTREAEEGVAGDKVRAVSYLPRSSVYAMTGDRLSWEIDLPKDGAYQIYAMVYATTNGLADARATLNGKEYTWSAAPNTAENWQLAPLINGAEPLPQGKATLELFDLRGHFDLENRVESATFIDRLVIVEENENGEAFRLHATRMLEWMNRQPRIPRDPFGGIPKVPTEF